MSAGVFYLGPDILRWWERTLVMLSISSCRAVQNGTLKVFRKVPMLQIRNFLILKALLTFVVVDI